MGISTRVNSREGQMYGMVEGSTFGQMAASMKATGIMAFRMAGAGQYELMAPSIMVITQMANEVDSVSFTFFCLKRKI